MMEIDDRIKPIQNTYMDEYDAPPMFLLRRIVQEADRGLAVHFFSTYIEKFKCKTHSLVVMDWQSERLEERLEKFHIYRNHEKFNIGNKSKSPGKGDLIIYDTPSKVLVGQILTTGRENELQYFFIIPTYYRW